MLLDALQQRLQEPVHMSLAHLLCQAVVLCRTAPGIETVPPFGRESPDSGSISADPGFIIVNLHPYVRRLGY